MNTTAEIYDLMETTGKSAPDITQALKNIGGDMQTGVKKIATYFLDEGRYEGYQVGKQIGEKNGLLKGTIIGLRFPHCSAPGTICMTNIRLRPPCVCMKQTARKFWMDLRPQPLRR